MNFTKLINRIKDAYIAYGYSRSAIELSRFSTSQLAEVGISKQLLSQGASAYPWRLEEDLKGTTDNVVSLKPSTYEIVKQSMPIIPKAA